MKISKKIEAFERKQAEEREAFRKELAIEERVPEGGRVHVGKLWGTIGGVTYGDTIGRNPCSWDRAVEIVRALPPIARAQVRDSCLSHPPMAYVDSLPEEKKERWQQESRIAPVMLHVDGGTGYGPRLSIEWYARVSEGMICVKVELGCPPHGVVDYSVKRREMKGRTEYSDARVSVGIDLHTVHANGEPVAMLASPIRWASGGPEYPSNISLYFDEITADPDPAKVGIAIVEHVAALVIALGKCRRAMAKADARAASPKVRAKSKRRRNDC